MLERRNTSTTTNEDLSRLPELTWYVSPCNPEDVPLVEFVYLVFTRMSGESYRGYTFGGLHVPCIYTHAR